MNRECADCGTALAQGGRGRPRKYCLECRPAARRPIEPRDPIEFISKQSGYIVPSRRGECVECAQPIRISHTSSESPRCRGCFSLKATRGRRKNLCADCGNPSYGERCRPCAQDAGTYGQRIRSDDDYRVTRRLREQAAPGLSATERSNLLATWRRKGKRCTYCPALGTTVDHVLPLVRGGTNHEGNLTPCCKPCNSSKGGKTVAEWRSGRRLPPMKNPPPWATIVAKPRAKRARATVQLELTPCSGCGALGMRKRCGDPECFRTEMRNRYRQRVGIPLDAPLYARASVLS